MRIATKESNQWPCALFVSDLPFSSNMAVDSIVTPFWLIKWISFICVQGCVCIGGWDHGVGWGDWVGSYVLKGCEWIERTGEEKVHHDIIFVIFSLSVQETIIPL